MMDSIIAANSGSAKAVRGAPRRVAVVEPRENRLWPEVPLLGRAVADSLRRMLRVRRTEFSVVDPDSVQRGLGFARQADSLGAALSTELIVSIQFLPTKTDSGFV